MPSPRPAARTGAAPAPIGGQHLSAANATRQGITIHGEAVATGAHALYLILEAPDEGQVARFMAPFAQVGSVEVIPASPCEEVIGRGC
ncbi:MAG TPA: DUF3303 family protein [Thermomicrobiales bacterium]|nr:DUF3303 family protein [Thermomicrobiales bacterium]